jgi:hypothetical protein
MPMAVYHCFVVSIIALLGCFLQVPRLIRTRDIGPLRFLAGVALLFTIPAACFAPEIANVTLHSSINMHMLTCVFIVFLIYQ